MLKKYKTVLGYLLAAMAISGCASDGKKSETAADTPSVSSPQSENSAAIADDDSAGPTAAATAGLVVADTTVAARISKILPDILKKELTGVVAEDRQFAFDQADLDGDGKNELFVGFKGMNWCGSGGCTALLLTPDGELITRFTVVDFPFTILPDRTKGWKDLLVYSGHADRVLKFDGKRYPSNPSVSPKYAGKPDSSATRALSLSDPSYPWFKF